MPNTPSSGARESSGCRTLPLPPSPGWSERLGQGRLGPPLAKPKQKPRHSQAGKNDAVRDGWRTLALGSTSGPRGGMPYYTASVGAPARGSRADLRPRLGDSVDGIKTTSEAPRVTFRRPRRGGQTCPARLPRVSSWSAGEPVTRAGASHAGWHGQAAACPCFRNHHGSRRAGTHATRHERHLLRDNPCAARDSSTFTCEAPRRRLPCVTA